MENTRKVEHAKEVGMGIAIQLIDVEKYFGAQKVLDKVNLTVFEGKTTLIVGGSGQGKSVILKHMLGLIKADRGQVLVFGKDLARISSRELKEIRKNFGVLFQNGALLDSLNVYDNVALPLRERTGLSEREISENVEDKLQMMDLLGSEKKYPAQLSGGMQKRVALARALVLNPRVVFFDEPTTGLDVGKSNEIYRLFHKTQASLHYTAVIVSHDVPKIFKLADYVALIETGVIKGYMTPEEFQLSDDPDIRSFVETTMGPIYTSAREEPPIYETI